MIAQERHDGRKDFKLNVIDSGATQERGIRR